MLASELIKELEFLRERFGDLPVRFDGSRDDHNANIDSVEFYDATGNKEGEIVEIFLH